MDDAEDQKRHNDQQANNDVDQKHPGVEHVFVGLRSPPLKERHARQIGAVCTDDGEQSQHDIEDDAKLWSDGLANNLLRN